MPTTTHYGLYLNDDDTEMFRSWRDKINGMTDSNMIKIDTALAGKQDTLTIDNTPTANSNNPVKSGGVYASLAGKQNKLTFDSTPTVNSNNPVTSDGIYRALLVGSAGCFQCIYDTTTFDSITTALDDGKLPVCAYNGDMYIYQGYTTNNTRVGRYVFAAIARNYLLGGKPLKCRLITCTEASAWGAEDHDLLDSVSALEIYATKTDVNNATDIYLEYYGADDPDTTDPSDAAAVVANLMNRGRSVFCVTMIDTESVYLIYSGVDSEIPSAGAVNLIHHFCKVIHGKFYDLTLTVPSIPNDAFTPYWDFTITELVGRASPSFTGTPTAPTADAGTSTTQIATTAFVQGAIAGKQNTLTFDSAPTYNSQNPVTSGGVYTALANVQDTLTVDNVPTANSDNLVSSGGVAAALTDRNLTWATLTLSAGIGGSIRYAKDKSGIVWLKIATVADTAAAAQTLGVLPSGYRPEFVHIFFGYNTDHGFTLRYTVSSDGTIRAYAFYNPPDTILNANTNTFKTCRGYAAFVAE